MSPAEMSLDNAVWLLEFNRCVVFTRGTEWITAFKAQDTYIAGETYAYTAPNTHCATNIEYEGTTAKDLVEQLFACGYGDPR